MQPVLKLLKARSAPLALMVLAVAIRLYNLLAMDPYIDEIGWAHWLVDLFDPGNPITFMTSLSEEARPPLYYWLALVFRDIDPNAFVGLRTAAALASGATAGALYLLGTFLWSRTVGAIAGLLWAVLPFGVFTGRIGASDDSLVALFTVLTLYASAKMVRHPSVRSGAFCGICLGLTIMSKTSGVFATFAPILALAVLARRSDLSRMWPASLALAGTALITVSPLVPWLPMMLKRSSAYADVAVPLDPQGDSLSATIEQLLQLGRLPRNVGYAIDVYRAYLGDALLAIVLVGVILATLRRDKAALFLAALFLLNAVIVLDLISVIYSRYLLALSIYLYALAAVSCIRISEEVSWKLRATKISVLQSDNVNKILATSIALTILYQSVPRTYRMITDPYNAHWTKEDRWQYINQWWTFYGISEIASTLSRAAEAEPITVIYPQNSSANSFNMPHRALRFYLRGNESIDFALGPPIVRARSDASYRPWMRTTRPTFVVLNEAPPEEIRSYPGEPSQIRQWFETAMPSAALVYRVPRPEGPHALALYRIDRGATDSRR